MRKIATHYLSAKGTNIDIIPRKTTEKINFIIQPKQAYCPKTLTSW
ncbi:MAG: hypothetical protein ACETWK_09845 [Candidatus Aminicenantaceae bacterium]